MIVRLSEALSDPVADNVGEHGAHESVNEYTPDLIRRDSERVEKDALKRLKAELAHPFAAPEDTYKPLAAGDVIDARETRENFAL